MTSIVIIPVTTMVAKAVMVTVMIKQKRGSN